MFVFFRFCVFVSLSFFPDDILFITYLHLFVVLSSYFSFFPDNILSLNEVNVFNALCILIRFGNIMISYFAGLSCNFTLSISTKKIPSCLCQYSQAGIDG